MATKKKGSDVNLAAVCSMTHGVMCFDVAAVLTNDPELAAPIRFNVARNETVLIIYPDNNPARSLTNNATVACICTTSICTSICATGNSLQKLPWQTARWFVSLWGFKHLPGYGTARRSS